VNPQAIGQAAAGWNAAADVGNAAAVVSNRIEAEDDKATLNEMIITREREKIDLKAAEEKRYEGAPEGFAKHFETLMQKRDEETISALPTRMQQAYKMTTAQSNLKDYEQNFGWETERRVAVVGDKIARAGKEVIGLSYTYGSQGVPFDEVVKNIDATMVAGSGVLAPEKLAKFIDDLRSDAAKQYLSAVTVRDPRAAQDLLNSGKLAKYLTPEDMTKASKDIWNATPDLMKLEQIKTNRTGSSETMALDTILKNEGGYVARDGASGQPAIYGINKGAHKEAYEQAEKITKEQGEAAGQEYARQFYKKEYFDKYDIGTLKPEVQTIVADGMVNHWQGFKTKLLQAAKDGATPDQLIEMRRGEYERLAEADAKYKPSLQGWLNRLDNLPVRMGNAYDAMPYGEKVNEVEKISKAIADDPAKAAMQYGANTPQAIAQVQAGLGVKPQDARVLTNSQAQEFATKINASQDSNAVLQAYAELKSDYQDFTDNAIQDLVATGKLKPEMNAALGLASRPEAQKYRDQIDLLGAMAKTTEAAIKEDYKMRGYDESSLTSELPAKYFDIQSAMLNEDPGNQGVINQQAGVVFNLARMKIIKDGSSYSDAMKFATKAVFDDFDVAMVNGVPVRVPTSYSVDIIEDEAETFIKEKIPSLINPNQSKDYEYVKKEIVASMNKAQDGLVFFSPTVGAIADKDGNPLEVSFKTLIGDKKARPKPGGPYNGAIPIMRGGF
jgi:lysozyme family protein